MPAPTVDWNALIGVRESVLKALEDLRVAEVIGSGLDASVAIYADGELLDQLQQLGDELRFVFITSEAKAYPADERPEAGGSSGEKQRVVEAEGYWIVVSATESDKCVRCWHRRPEVGQVASHPELCERCVGNIDGRGEERRFA